ncbi:MAG: DsrE/DsrF/DrsH-like family protein [Pseudomonadota bacterium]|nr:DsrE/DsrF/DrsH-like family protein [Pseudomonadota bacterium]
MRKTKSLSIIAFSSDFGKIHYALSTAAAASATNMSVTIMFTMGAIQAVATHSSGTPGWEKLTDENTKAAGLVQDKVNQRNGIAGFEELLAACISMGVKFLVCEMGLKAGGIQKEQLRQDTCFEPGGLVTFLNTAEAKGNIVFV